MAEHVEYQPQPSRRRLSADQNDSPSRQTGALAPWLVLVVMLVVGGVVWGGIQANSEGSERAEQDRELAPAERLKEVERNEPSALLEDESIAEYVFRDNPRELSREAELQNISYSPSGQQYCHARINHKLVSVGDSVLDGEFEVEAIRPSLVILRDQQGNFHRLVLASRVQNAARLYRWNPEEIKPDASSRQDDPQDDANPEEGRY